VLETVRLLSDFETPEAKLLHIILVGQPQLAKQLGCPQMSQLLQRIPMMNFLRPLEPREVTEYIDHRLRVAGYSGPQLFTTSALERIAELSNGVPRKINRICFNALSLGCALATKQIERSLIDEVGADLDLGLLLKNVNAGHPAETPAEIGQVGKVKVAENVIPDSTHAAPEKIGRVATTKDARRMQPCSSPRTSSSAVVDSDPSGLTNQQWKEDVREALAYIQEFLARYKPVATTPQE